jgi:hypothetical protein
MVLFSYAVKNCSGCISIEYEMLVIHDEEEGNHGHFMVL